MTELDPSEIRTSLAESREKGFRFEYAWAIATGHGIANGDRDLFLFMKRHFRSAYEDAADRQGRCFVPERETSNAVLIRREHEPTNDYERCRSGDDCDRPAVCGRFGRMWCEYHGTELERLRALFKQSQHDLDPRHGGNHTIFGMKGTRKVANAA